MSKLINMLTNVQTAEVSLVRRGANNKRFALTKSKDQPMDFEKLLKTVLATEAEGEAEMVATLKAAGASEETIKVATAQYRFQSGFADQVSSDEFAIVAKAAGYEFAKAKKEDDEDDDKDEDKFPFKGKKKKSQKAVVGMPAELQKEFDDQKAEMEAVRKESADNKAELVTLRKENIRKEFVAKCKNDYSHAPGQSAEEQGEMLQKAYEVSEDFGKQVEGQLKATSDAIKKSSLLNVSGHRNSTPSESSAEGQMEAVIKSYIEADSTLNKDTAMVRLMDEQPGLYAQYIQENPAQRGGR